MKSVKTIGAVTAALCGIVATSQANLIINGSFEQHDMLTNPYNDPNWGLFYGTPGNEVLGWVSSGGLPIEIGTGGTYGVTGFVGNDVMELDSTANVKVNQIVTTANGLYTLSFLYAARLDQPTTTTQFEVFWNNNFVASFSPANNAMTSYFTTVTGIALAGYNTLEFRGTGTSDSYGALIDNVQLVAVPEASTVVAGALMLLPFGIGAVRSLRKDRTA